MAALGYDDALAALKRALAFGMNPSLDGISALCEELGRPQDAFVVVQVTGTNGKTSTARLTHALLAAHGRRAALYTSPELERYPERMELGDGPVNDDDFALAVSAALDAAERIRPLAQGTPAGFTEFELLTASALWLFRERRVEIAVLEVGMGGRWDATSVAPAAVAVITGVGLDHTAVLGETIEAIAAEKAAIIRPASAPVLGPGTAGIERVFLERAEAAGTHARAVRESGSPSPVAEELTVRYELRARPANPAGTTLLDVRGIHGEYPGLELAAPAYQAANAATAVAAAEALLGRALDVAAVREALHSVVLPGRFEVVRRDPVVIVDGSHNPQAAEVLAGAIADAWPDPSLRPFVLLGVLADKDAEGIVRALSRVAGGLAVTAPCSARALPAEKLADVVERVTGVRPAVHADVEGALRSLVGVRGAGGALVVTGSLTTAGEARAALRHI